MKDKNVSQCVDSLCCSRRTIQRHVARYHMGTLFTSTRYQMMIKTLKAVHSAVIECEIRIDCTFSLEELRIILFTCFHLNVSISSV